jgi:hypothetical protein
LAAHGRKLTFLRAALVRFFCRLTTGNTKTAAPDCGFNSSMQHMH